MSAVGRAKVTNESRSLFLLLRDQVRVAYSLRSLRKLGQIPFFPSIGMSGEAGVPVLESHSGDEEAYAFQTIAAEVRKLVEQ